MPQIFRIGGYIIYFWSNENNPLEPIHFHIAEGKPTQNATKVWITKAKKCLVCNNNSKIPNNDLRDILRIVEARADEVICQWIKHFGEISYYC